MILERPVDYLAGTARMTWQLLAGEPEKLSTDWKTQNARLSRDEWDDRVEHLLSRASDAQRNELDDASAVVELVQPPGWDPMLPVLFVLGALLTALVPRLRPALVLSLAVFGLLVTCAALDGPVDAVSLSGRSADRAGRGRRVAWAAVPTCRATPPSEAGRARRPPRRPGRRSKGPESMRQVGAGIATVTALVRRHPDVAAHGADRHAGGAAPAGVPVPCAGDPDRRQPVALPARASTSPTATASSRSFDGRPVYALFAAGTILLLGDDLRALAFVQQVLGVGTALLAYGLGRETFGRLAGLLAGPARGAERRADLSRARAS